MKKIKSTYTCQNCGTPYAKQQGKCTACLAWNTIVEEAIHKTVVPWESPSHNRVLDANQPKQLQAIGYEADNCTDKALSRTLGGGIVPGSLVLIGGEPGIGKSTLLLQIALSLASKKVLYISGEESEAQIKMRASRIERQSDNCYILNETLLANIFQ